MSQATFRSSTACLVVVAALCGSPIQGDEPVAAPPTQDIDVPQPLPMIFEDVEFGPALLDPNAANETPAQRDVDAATNSDEDTGVEIERVVELTDADDPPSKLNSIRIQPAIPPKGLDGVTPPGYISSDRSKVAKVARAERGTEPELIPRTQLPTLSRDMQQRKSRIDQALAIYSAQRISNAKRSPWGLMHAMIPFGAEAMIAANGRSTNAVSWLCANGNGRDLRLFYTKGGKIGIRVGPGLQGHEGQFLAMMAQSRVSRRMPITVGSSSFTIEDVMRYEMASCRDGEELTFKLIGLVHYLPSDHQWKNDRGETFDIQRLIREELKQKVNGAACGGTHRLMGYSYAVRKRRERGEPVDGQWQRADAFVNSFLNYTQGRLRNSDGSYSTNWFEGRGMDRDLDKRIQTTGHMLEWVVFSLPHKRLDDRDVTQSIDYLTNLLMRRRSEELEVGPRGHAIRALVLYDQRMFKNPPRVATAAKTAPDVPTQAKIEKSDVDSDLR